MNRRTFLTSSAATAVTTSGGLPFLRGLAAYAQNRNPSDYKALVCAFLGGGNDSNNLVIPMDQTQYSLYLAARGQLSIPQGQLLPILAGEYGLHPSMNASQTLFNAGQLAILPNLGTLVQPTTAAQFIAGTVSVPNNLFSHSDQQNCMQTALQSSGQNPGWGGLIADVLAGYSTPSFPVAMSIAESSLFTNGASTIGYVVPVGSGSSCNEGDACGARDAAERAILGIPSNVTLVTAAQNIKQSMYRYNSTFQSALAAAAPLKTVFSTTNPFAGSLSKVAATINARGQLGSPRQIFLVMLGGFDTHQSQLETHSALLAYLDDALSTFYNATVEMGVADQVTLFTLSDFSRTLQVNSAVGSDHAWGGHHLVLGGAVKGGHMYGRFPTLELGGPDDAGSYGVWAPSTSVAQLAATLASWFGVASADLPSVVPLVRNFSNPLLGFI